MQRVAKIRVQTFFLLAFLLGGCAPADDTKVIVGTVMQTLASDDGGVTATLTREGDRLRVYLQGKNEPLAKMLQTDWNGHPKLAWRSSSLLMLEGFCGGTIRYTKSNDYKYPHGDGIGVGFWNNCL